MSLLKSGLYPEDNKLYTTHIFRKKTFHTMLTHVLFCDLKLLVVYRFGPIVTYSALQGWEGVSKWTIFSRVQVKGLASEKAQEWGEDGHVAD